MKEHIIINRDRVVTVPQSLRKIGVQYDHNVNTLIFDCPRYWDDVDLSTMKIYINYKLSDKTPGSYLAKNVRVSETDENLVHFDWRITRKVTKLSGSLTCLVCAKLTNEEGIEENHWNSDIFSTLLVTGGMENEEVIEEENTDLITQLLLSIDTTNHLVDELDTTMNKVKNDTDEATVVVSQLQDHVTAIAGAYAITWNEGGYISRQDGTVNAEEGSSYSDFIEVEPGSRLIITNTMTTDNEFNAFYDASETFLSSFSNATGALDVPSGAYKMRLSKYSSATIMIAADLQSEIDAAEAEIEELKSDLDDVTSDLEYEVNYDTEYIPKTSYDIEVGDIDINGNKLDDYDWVRRRRFDCPSESKIILSNNNHDKVTPFIVFFDFNDSVIGYQIATENGSQNYTIYAPKGTAYFYEMTTNSSFIVKIYIKKKESVFINALKNIPTNPIYPTLKYYDTSYSVEEGGVDNDGSFTNWNWTRRKKFDCDEDFKVQLTNAWHDLTTPVIAFYDKDDKLISCGYNTEEQSVLTNFISPKNTSYFYLITTNGQFNVQIYGKESETIISHLSWYDGKTASALGDSITEGGEYHYFVKDYLNLVSYKNCGISGSGVIFGNDAMWQDVRINSLDASSDVVTIMMGTNDVYRCDSITENDFTLSNHDTTNFVGAYNVALSKIFYRFLNIDKYYDDIDYTGIERLSNFKEPNRFLVFIITPPKRFDSKLEGADTKIIKVNEYVKRIAQMWGLPCIDAGETMLNDCNKYLYWEKSGDLLHPPYQWHKKLSRLIISKLLEHEPI